MTKGVKVSCVTLAPLGLEKHIQLTLAAWTDLRAVRHAGRCPSLLAPRRRR
jgi:hypothetical protein